MYPKELNELASKIGFKASSLVFLSKNADCLVNDDYLVQVPSFNAISSQEIYEHLELYIPNLNELWKEFINSYNEHKSISAAEPAKILMVIRNEIKNCFINNPITIEGLLNGHSSFMIRSTGNEDQVDLANQGGNDSFPSDIENIQVNIGKVIASYFSEKSLSQRIAANQDISNLPLAACLIQSFVSSQDTVAGVVFTGSGNSRIQVALGHAKLIVEGRGNFDDYFITPQNIYAEVNFKNFGYYLCGNSLSLKKKYHPFETASKASLSSKAANYIHEVSQKLEKLYGMEVDIEFIFDETNKLLNIVQVRAITEDKLNSITPSALDNKYIADNQPENIDASVVTSNLKHIFQVDKKEQILITDTLENGLKKFYTFSQQEKANIKVFLVRDDIPSTSHPASFLSSISKLVLRVKNYNQAKNWVEKIEGKILLCDPQHGKIFRIKSAEFNPNIIQDGIIASTLSTHVSVLEDEAIDSSILDSSFLKQAFLSKKKYSKGDLLANLKAISSPTTNMNQLEDKKVSLVSIIKTCAGLFKKGFIEKGLTYKIFKVSLELQDLQKKIVHEGKYELVETYFDVYKKFEGLLVGQSGPGIISNSVVQELNEHRNNEKYLQFISNKDNYNSIEKEYLIQLMKLEQSLLAPSYKHEWYDFCKKIIKDEPVFNAFLMVVSKVIPLGMQSYVINNMFMPNNFSKFKQILLEEQKGLGEHENKIMRLQNIIEDLSVLPEEFASAEKFESSYLLLKNKLGQIKESIKFADPKELASLRNSKIAYISVLKNLEKFVEIIDLSLKSIQTSSDSLYSSDISLKANNFLTLLTFMFGVLQNIANENFEGQDIKEGLGYIDECLKKLDDYFKNPSEEKKAELLVSYKINPNKKAIFSPSKDFDVSSLSIFTKALNKGWGASPLVYIMDETYHKSLVDYHTLVHQNLLKCIKKLLEEKFKIENYLPREVSNIHNDILASSSFFKNRFISNFKAEFEDYKVNGKIVELEYIITLRQHASRLIISYDKFSNEVLSTKYKIFGVNENSRWDDFAKNFKKLALYFAQLEVTKMVINHSSFEIEFKPQDLHSLKIVCQLLNNLNVITFPDHEGIEAQKEIQKAVENSLGSFQKLSSPYLDGIIKLPSPARLGNSEINGYKKTFLEIGEGNYQSKNEYFYNYNAKQYISPKMAFNLGALTSKIFVKPFFSYLETKLKPAEEANQVQLFDFYNNSVSFNNILLQGAVIVAQPFVMKYVAYEGSSLASNLVLSNFVTTQALKLVGFNIEFSPQDAAKGLVTTIFTTAAMVYMPGIISENSFVAGLTVDILSNTIDLGLSGAAYGAKLAHDSLTDWW